MRQSLQIGENSAILQARIEGLQLGQVPAVNRLRKLGVPEGLINAAAQSGQTSYEKAEHDIVMWTMNNFSVRYHDALDILNGRVNPVQHC